MVDDSRLDAIAEQTSRERGMVGLAAAALVDGRPAYVRTSGLADVEHGRPVTASTLFRVASISKTFTAIAVMQLVEEGRLRLDDPINDHLLRNRVLHKDSKTAPVLVRHLLTHTSGLTEPPRLRDFFATQPCHRPEGRAADADDGGADDPCAAAARASRG